MRESKVHMPKELEKTCHDFILVYATAVIEVVSPRPVLRAMPIPYTIPIDELELHISMVVGLGRVFGFRLSDAEAKDIVSACIGAAKASSMTRWPITTIVERPETREAKKIWSAAARTEALGWLVAEDFYRMSNGEKPENIHVANITEYEKELIEVFEYLRFPKKG